MAEPSRQSAADRAGLRPGEWLQLERLAQLAENEWITAKASAPGLTGQQASVGLRNLRARGLAEYRQDPWTHVGLWSATEEGVLLSAAVLNA